MELFDEYGYLAEIDAVESMLAAAITAEPASTGLYDRYGVEWRLRSVEAIRAASAAGEPLADVELSIWQHSILPGDTAQLLAEDPAQATGQILEHLLSDNEFDVRIAAASSPVRSVDEAFGILESDEFVNDFHDEVQNNSGKFGSMRWLVPHAADLLARSALEVHRIVAARASEDPGELLELAQDESGRVRRAACANPNAPGSIKRRSDDLSHFQRQAQSRKTAPATLAELAVDRDERVRRLVAENPSTPTVALWELLGRVDDIHLIANPEAPADLVEAIANRSSLFDERVDESYSFLSTLARNTWATQRVFYRMADLFRDDTLEQHDELRRALLWNTAVPHDVLADYVNHRSSEARRAIASNPSADLDLVEVLAEDPDEAVRRAARHRRDAKLRADERANRTPAEQQAIDEAVAAHLRSMKRLRFTRPFAYRQITKGIRETKRASEEHTKEKTSGAGNSNRPRRLASNNGAGQGTSTGPLPAR